MIKETEWLYTRVFQLHRTWNRSQYIEPITNVFSRLEYYIKLNLIPLENIVKTNYSKQKAQKKLENEIIAFTILDICKNRLLDYQKLFVFLQ